MTRNRDIREVVWPENRDETFLKWIAEDAALLYDSGFSTAEVRKYVNCSGICTNLECKSTVALPHQKFAKRIPLAGWTEVFAKQGTEIRWILLHIFACREGPIY